MLDWVGGQRHAPAALPPGKTRYPLYRRLGGPQGRSGRHRYVYNGINCIKSLAPGAGNVNELMSQVGTVREVVCAQINVFP